MTKFLLFIIILNFVVVGYNLYMWFTVQIENKTLNKENEKLLYQQFDTETKESLIKILEYENERLFEENEELRYNLNLKDKEYFKLVNELNDIKNKKD